METVANKKNQKLINKKRNGIARRNSSIQCYIILAVPIIGFLIFTLYPYLWASKWSLFYYTGTKTDAVFVGLENFKDIFTKNTEYWDTWLTTLKFAFWKIPIEIPLALFLAILLNKSGLKFAGFFRAAYYLPCIISVAIIGVVFSNMFDYFGVINSFLVKFGVISEPLDWFSDAKTSMMVLVIASIWQTLGTNILFFIAALAGVPKELYESAEIDGAGKIRQIFKITIPMIAPVFQTILLLSINGTLHISEMVIALNNGAPGGETFTVGAYLIDAFVPGFSGADPNIGYGSALSIITSIIYCFIAFGYMKFSEKMSEIY